MIVVNIIQFVEMSIRVLIFRANTDSTDWTIVLSEAAAIITLIITLFRTVLSEIVSSIVYQSNRFKTRPTGWIKIGIVFFDCSSCHPYHKTLI